MIEEFKRFIHRVSGLKEEKRIQVQVKELQIRTNEALQHSEETRGDIENRRRLEAIRRRIDIVSGDPLK